MATDFLHEARPIKDHPLGLPSNFRAVRYLDVFGWTADSETRKEVVKNEKGQLVSEAVTEAKRIRRDIERILHAHDAQLNNEEIEKLMKAATMITKAIRNDSDIKQVIWLLMEKQTENSMKKQFFVHVPSELAGAGENMAQQSIVNVQAYNPLHTLVLVTKKMNLKACPRNAKKR